MAVARIDTTEPGGIVTSLIAPPIARRDFDWAAYRDGDELGLVGYGATEEAAKRELQELIEENLP